jgi:hypothetical protein
MRHLLDHLIIFHFYIFHFVSQSFVGITLPVSGVALMGATFLFPIQYSTVLHIFFFIVLIFILVLPLVVP